LVLVFLFIKVQGDLKLEDFLIEVEFTVFWHLEFLLAFDFVVAFISDNDTSSGNDVDFSGVKCVKPEFTDEELQFEFLFLSAESFNEVHGFLSSKSSFDSFSIGSVINRKLDSYKDSLSL
jgi:hypothetical protein